MSGRQPPPSFADGLAALSNQVRDLERHIRRLQRENDAMRRQLIALGVQPAVESSSAPVSPLTASPMVRTASGMVFSPSSASPLPGTFPSPAQAQRFFVQTPQPVVAPSPPVELLNRRLVFDVSKGENPDEIRFIGIPLQLESQLPHGTRILTPGMPAGAWDPQRLTIVLDPDDWIRAVRYG